MTIRLPFILEGETAGAGELTSLPGCAQVAVSHASFLKPAFRGRGFGKTMHQRRLNYAKDAAYDYVLCTVVSTNAPQKRILTQHNWRKLDQFLSSRSDEMIELWGKVL